MRICVVRAPLDAYCGWRRRGLGKNGGDELMIIIRESTEERVRWPSKFARLAEKRLNMTKRPMYSQAIK